MPNSLDAATRAADGTSDPTAVADVAAIAVDEALDALRDRQA